MLPRNGIRQNTRDMRVKERMQSRRQELVEEMIKRDPLYRPPADYRCGCRVQSLGSGLQRCCCFVQEAPGLLQSFAGQDSAAGWMSL